MWVVNIETYVGVMGAVGVVEVVKTQNIVSNSCCMHFSSGVCIVYGRYYRRSGGSKLGVRTCRKSKADAGSPGGGAEVSCWRKSNADAAAGGGALGSWRPICVEVHV